MTDASIPSLHKYWIWSNLMKIHFYTILEKGGKPKGINFVDSWHVFMSYWYSSLYVVIEGWMEQGLQDDEINKMLESPNVALLKRYRNGVCHFQKNYFDPRFVEFIAQGENCVEWILNLHESFGRYFLAWHKKMKKGGN